MPGLFKIMQTLLLLCIFIGGLSWASEARKLKGCFTAEELESGALKIIRRHRYPTEDELKRLHPNHSEKNCPTSLNARSLDYSHRSVSPWRYRIDSKEGRFPEKIAFAECLCKGCIIINGSGHQAEDHNYNSVPIKQTQMVLEKTKCRNDPSKYSFISLYIEVPIACTCVKYRSST
ncbi:interleukin-17C [Esox lucius]|uniref:Interleukin-17C n=1 Tax=Esox lucius TaxID=8010 RepID=A0A3P8YE78_ESOLU|nr:interleukin-17C [Esox lucius]